jgi:hypothetical protein
LTLGLQKLASVMEANGLASMEAKGDPEAGQDPETGQVHLFRLEMDPSEFPSNTDWTCQTFFTCYICGDEVDGYKSSITHILDSHPDSGLSDDPEKTFPCIVCPKSFFNENQLKMHLWRHLIQICPWLPKASAAAPMTTSTPTSKTSSSRRRIKSEPESDSDHGDDDDDDDDSEADDDDSYLNFQIRLKKEPNFFPDGCDWSSQTYFNCFICGTETDGFRASVDHIRTAHAETLTRDKNCACIVCPKLFARMDHLKKHVWSHVNRVSPGVPPHFANANNGESRKQPKLEKPTSGIEAPFLTTTIHVQSLHLFLGSWAFQVPKSPSAK